MRRLGAATLLAVTLAGCGTVDSSQTADQRSADELADDGAYYFDQVRYVREEIAPATLGQPRTMQEALPCAKRDQVGGTPTTAVVIGSIVSVEPGDAKIYGEDEEDLVYADDFYDPKVSERNVVVTVDATDGVDQGGAEIKDTFRFRVGVMGMGDDPRRFIGSLASVGEVIVLLSAYPDGRRVGEYFPSLLGAGLGMVDEKTGQISFSGFGENEDAFVGQLDNVDSILDSTIGFCR